MWPLHGSSLSHQPLPKLPLLPEFRLAKPQSWWQLEAWGRGLTHVTYLLWDLKNKGGPVQIWRAESEHISIVPNSSPRVF